MHFFEINRLQKIFRYTDMNRGFCKFKIIISRQQNNLHLRTDLFRPPCELQSVHLRHLNITQNNVWFVHSHQGKPFLSIFCLCHYGTSIIFPWKVAQPI